MTAANRYIFGRATRRKPRFLAFPKTPLFNHLWVKTSFFKKKQGFRGRGYPLGALQHVHQGNAAATVGAHGLAKMARRTVPYGFSCSSCAHMGRLAPRFSHGLSPQQPRSRSPPPKIPPRRFRGGCSTCVFPDFGTFLGPKAGAANSCPTRSSFGQKIFFAQTPVSSRSSSTAVTRHFFVSWVL